MKLEPTLRTPLEDEFKVSSFTIYEFNSDGYGHVSTSYTKDWVLKRETPEQSINHTFKKFVSKEIAEGRIKLNKVTTHITVVSQLENGVGLAYCMKVLGTNLV